MVPVKSERFDSSSSPPGQTTAFLSTPLHSWPSSGGWRPAIHRTLAPSSPTAGLKPVPTCHSSRSLETFGKSHHSKLQSSLTWFPKVGIWFLVKKHSAQCNSWQDRKISFYWHMAWHLIWPQVTVVLLKLLVTCSVSMFVWLAPGAEVKLEPTS